MKELSALLRNGDPTKVGLSRGLIFTRFNVNLRITSLLNTFGRVKTSQCQSDHRRAVILHTAYKMIKNELWKTFLDSDSSKCQYFPFFQLV